MSEKRALIVGASGATGKRLVEHLLLADYIVKVVIRPTSNIPAVWKSNDQIQLIYSEVNNMTIEEMAGHISDCHAVASCLGHNLSWKGVYGKPRKLVLDAVRLLADAITLNAPESPVKIVLMNTAGNSNRDLDEQISFGQQITLGLIRLLLPPHVDNEKAADYLRVSIGQVNPHIQWAVVRPDNLIDEETVTPYDVHPSPTRSAIFDPGKTSRINVGHFMAQLISDDEIWTSWKGQMPVIYNSESDAL